MRFKEGLRLIAGICLITSFLLILLSDKTIFFKPCTASLYLSISNESNETLELATFVYADSGLFNFSNSIITPLTGDLYVGKTSDGSGFQLYKREFQSKESITVIVKNITVSSHFSSNLSGVRPRFLNSTFSLADISYDMVISIYNRYGISIASGHFFVMCYKRGQIEYPPEFRGNLESYLKFLCATAIFTGFVVLLSIKKEVILSYFPFISVFLIWFSLLIFIFIGSGYELNVSYFKVPFSVIAFLIHGDNQHINGNLVYFTIVSFLSELFIKMRGKTMKNLFVWFLCPLFVFPEVSQVVQLLKTGKFGFGLSFSIESMTWSLWAYIIANFKEVIKNKLHVFMVLLSGIPLQCFFDWLLYFLLGYYKDNPYYENLAIGHILYGVVTLIIILILYLLLFMSQNRSKIRKFPRTPML
jgi:hypothetical protein